MPNPTAHPLSAPVVTGTQVTVDLLLQTPTRITRAVTDLSLARFLASNIFTNGGTVTGGAVLFDVVLAPDLYPDRTAAQVAPLGEFPIVTSSRRAPSVARVSKFGGKWVTSDEARDRNNAVLFDRELRLQTNSMIRDDDLRAIAVVEATITGQAGALNFVGNNWNTVITAGSSASTNALYPHHDIALAQGLAEKDQLGIVYDTLVCHTDQAVALRTIYGGQLTNVLRDAGIDTLFSSPRMTPGSAYICANGQFGGRRLEKPLSTEVWREQKIQGTWTQIDQRSVLYADNPFALRKMTGLAG